MKTKAEKRKKEGKEKIEKVTTTKAINSKTFKTTST